jgi:hypothetical protein
MGTTWKKAGRPACRILAITGSFLPRHSGAFDGEYQILMDKFRFSISLSAKIEPTFV